MFSLEGVAKQRGGSRYNQVLHPTSKALGRQKRMHERRLALTPRVDGRACICGCLYCQCNKDNALLATMPLNDQRIYDDRIDIPLELSSRSRRNQRTSDFLTRPPNC